MAKRDRRFNAYKTDSYYGFSKEYPEGGKSPDGRYNKRIIIGKIFSGIKIFIAFALLFTVVYFGVTLMLDVSDLPIATEAPTENEGAISSSENTTAPPVVQETAVKGVYIKPNQFSDPESAKKFAENAVSKGINSAVVDIKKADGTIVYPTSVAAAQDAEAAAGAAENFSEILSALKDGGLDVIGVVNCFNDPLMARSKNEMAVHYNNTNVIWLDNSLDKGGKPWLNPYSQDAQNYITDIIKEVSSMPVDRIILAGVQFPSGYSLDLATYDGEETGESRNKTLVSFIEQIEKTVGEEKIIVSMTGDGAINGSADLYDGNLLDSGIAYAAPDMRLSQMKNIKLGDKTFASPSAQADEFMPLAATQLSQRVKVSGNDIALYPIIEASSIEDAQSTVEIFKNNSIDGYILYNENGTYGF